MGRRGAEGGKNGCKTRLKWDPRWSGGVEEGLKIGRVAMVEKRGR